MKTIIGYLALVLTVPAGLSHAAVLPAPCVSPNLVTGAVGAPTASTGGCLTVGANPPGNNANENLASDGLFVNPGTNDNVGNPRGFQLGQMSVAWKITNLGGGAYQYVYTFTNLNANESISHIILALGSSFCTAATTANTSTACIYNLETDSTGTTGINKGKSPCATPYSCDAADGATGFYNAGNPIANNSGSGTSNPKLPAGFATTAFQLEPILQPANNTGTFSLQFDSTFLPVWENIYVRDDQSQLDTTSVEAWNNSAAGFFIPAPGIAAPVLDASYQVRYAANLNSGIDSIVNIINTGGNDFVPVNGPGFGANSGGNICVNIYTLDPNEELLSCCSCLVTPNQVVQLKVQSGIMGNTLTGFPTPSATIKLLGSTNTTVNPSTCANTAATVAAASATNSPVGGFAAFGTTVHTLTAGKFAVTETSFIAAALSPSELTSLTTRCASILGNASGAGVCAGCTNGALGASHR